MRTKLVDSTTPVLAVSSIRRSVRWRVIEPASLDIRRSDGKDTALTELATIANFQVDALDVLVFANRALAGRAAAAHVASAILERAKAAPTVNVIFAAAPSQNEVLAGLVADQSIDWSRVTALHMDEYLGIDASHPASFRRYLQERLFGLVDLGPDQRKLIPGEDDEQPLATCLAYAQVLKAHPPDIVCAGIGENGHLAFNDPPVADFIDPLSIKVVRLDSACRTQQLNDGCFSTLEEVPTHAYTLTIPALLSAPILSVVVPGPRKTDAVLNTLRGPISESCPASVLRRHSGAKLFLDPDSARLVL